MPTRAIRIGPALASTVSASTRRVLAASFYPVPASPYNVLPYITLAWLVLGIGIALRLGVRRPEALSRIGRVFLVEGPEQPYPSAVPPDTVIEGAAGLRT